MKFGQSLLVNTVFYNTDKLSKDFFAKQDELISIEEEHNGLRVSKKDDKNL